MSMYNYSDYQCNVQVRNTYLKPAAIIHEPKQMHIYKALARTWSQLKRSLLITTINNPINNNAFYNYIHLAIWGWDTSGYEIF